jgi:hypothetical protein
MPAGAVTMTEGVATDAYDYVIAGQIDPAAAVEMVQDRTDAADRENLSPAALRDYCRRAAFDLYGSERRAISAERLPAVAERVANIIKREASAARIDALYVSKTQAPDQVQVTRSGNAAAAVWPAPRFEGTYGVQVQSKDPLDGTTDSATAYFSRSELEAFRDQITAALEAGK